MDGFFEKYGRVIIIAVAICFVLLYLTPMRNVVGSSINGFAGNFANKVGESLGTVKMPDGSGGKITVPEGVKAGSVLKIEGNEYIVLEQKSINQMLVITTNDIGKKQFQTGYYRQDGKTQHTYEDSSIDKYLENEWYNKLSPTMKSAIQLTNIKQASYAKFDDPDSKQETGNNGQVYNTLSRHIFLPSVEEIGKIVDLKDQNKTRSFLNGMSILTRDSYQGRTDRAIYFIYYGVMSWNNVGSTNSVRPAFVVDLTKVQSEIVGTTNYK